jgi:hypothetical protein
LVVSHEFQYVTALLQYIIDRLMHPISIQIAQADRKLVTTGTNTVGSFLNLNCGHNNAYSQEERLKLQHLLLQLWSVNRPQQQNQRQEEQLLPVTGGII